MSKRFALILAVILALGASMLMSTESWAPVDDGCSACYESP